MRIHVRKSLRFALQKSLTICSTGKVNSKDNGFRDSATELGRFAKAVDPRQPLSGNTSNPALTKLDRVIVASMDRRGGVTDFLSSPFVRGLRTDSSREIFHLASSFDARARSVAI